MRSARESPIIERSWALRPLPKKGIHNAAKVAIVIVTLEQPRCGLGSRTSPDPGAVGRRLRDVHAKSRFDCYRDSTADDRPIARRKPADAQRRDHLLFAEPG